MINAKKENVPLPEIKIVKATTDLLEDQLAPPVSPVNQTASAPNMETLEIPKISKINLNDIGQTSYFVGLE